MLFPSGTPHHRVSLSLQKKENKRNEKFKTLLRAMEFQ
jgi:hypothetical protein